MHKKVVSLLLPLGLLLQPVPAQAVQNAAQAGETILTVSVPETLPAENEMFSVTVDISGNPGICSAMLTLQSDTEVVKCMSAEKGEALADSIAAVNPAAPDGAQIATASASPVTTDGTIGIFTYQTIGAGDPQFRLYDTVLGDQDGNDIPFTVTVKTIKGDSDPSWNVPSAPAPDNKPASGTTGGSRPTEQQQRPVVPQEEENPIRQEPLPDPPSTSGKPDTAPASITFPDVPSNSWANEPIRRAAAAGLFQGFPDGTFRPNGSVTRAQFVTVLWRSAGRPATAQDAPFNDLATSAEEFRKAAAWGAKNGYVTGYQNADGSFSFHPDGTITREQAMTILFRYNGNRKGKEQLLTSVYDKQFTDSGRISAYAKDAIYWAVYNGILSGTSTATLDPQGLATRAQLAKILMGYLDSVKA